jgi:hypothetical protein
LGEERVFVNRRQIVFLGIFHDPLAIEYGQNVRDHKNPVRRVFVHFRKGSLEIVGLAHAERHDRESQARGFHLRRPVPQRHPEIVGIPQHRYPVHAGDGFL